MPDGETPLFRGQRCWESTTKPPRYNNIIVVVWFSGARYPLEIYLTKVERHNKGSRGRYRFYLNERIPKGCVEDCKLNPSKSQADVAIWKWQMKLHGYIPYTRGTSLHKLRRIQHENRRATRRWRLIIILKLFGISPFTDSKLRA